MVSREEITRMAREAGFVGFDGENKCLREFAALVAAAERNKLAAQMIQRGYATGHGDTTEDLLKELDWQIDERIAAEREACHALRQTLPNPHEHCQVSAHAYDMAIAAYGAAIRARGRA